MRGQEPGNDHLQQESAQAEWRPDRTIEHSVITGEVSLVSQSDRSQRGRDRSAFRCQDGTVQQDEGMGESGAGECNCKHLKQADYLGTRRGQHSLWDAGSVAPQARKAASALKNGQSRVSDAVGVFDLLWLPATTVLARARPHHDLVLENLLLRHQLAVLAGPTRARPRARPG